MSFLRTALAVLVELSRKPALCRYRCAPSFDARRRIGPLNDCLTCLSTPVTPLYQHAPRPIPSAAARASPPKQTVCDPGRLRSRSNSIASRRGSRKKAGWRRRSDDWCSDQKPRNALGDATSWICTPCSPVPPGSSRKYWPANSGILPVLDTGFRKIARHKAAENEDRHMVNPSPPAG